MKKRILTDIEEVLLSAMNMIDTHGIAVEESTHEELIEFIAELKQIANDALIKVGESLQIKS
jgi:DNA polymerase I-like protein with 3'-5' exonuclease and polymerase domains